MSSAAQFLHILPQATAPAAENMATDWLMLEHFPHPESARLRFYGWDRPSFTFGYGQKCPEARAHCPARVDLIRRPTGGGLVDHRSDWTYALVIPPAHALAQARACASYRTVHEALARALQESGVQCRLQPTHCADEVAHAALGKKLSVCFQQAEPFDVVRLDDSRKIAGAAQKRTRQGMLFQGSVDRMAVPELKNRENLAELFSQRLGEILQAKPRALAQPPFPPVLLAETGAKFAAAEWNEKR
ncbi:MAG TPA: lipoate--protein ligase family protein [Opitutales bacterium]|nr:lipoate--protein ligase family protein [Opitutales bacterium]